MTTLHCLWKLFHVFHSIAMRDIISLLDFQKINWLQLLGIYMLCDLFDSKQSKNLYLGG